VVQRTVHKNKMGVSQEMPKYIGTKIIHAIAQSQQDFQREQGKEVSVGEDQPGYYVVYEDGYKSWSPKDVFEKAYHQCNNMNFGLAIEAMKMGKKVCRTGWNGKGMWLYHVPANSYAAQTEAAKKEFGEMVPYGAYIAMKTAQGNVVPWLASQTDVLVDDWMIIE